MHRPIRHNGGARVVPRAQAALCPRSAKTSTAKAFRQPVAAQRAERAPCWAHRHPHQAAALPTTGCARGVTLRCEPASTPRRWLSGLPAASASGVRNTGVQRRATPGHTRGPRPAARTRAPPEPRVPTVHASVAKDGQQGASRGAPRDRVPTRVAAQRLRRPTADRLRRRCGPLAPQREAPHRSAHPSAATGPDGAGATARRTHASGRSACATRGLLGFSDRRRRRRRRSPSLQAS